MASELRVDTLKDSSGNNSVGMAYVAGGSAKAWVHFNASTGTPTAQGSLNLSSITDSGVGIFQPTYSSAFANDDYSFVAITGTGSAGGWAIEAADRTATRTKMYTLSSTDNLSDYSHNNALAHGDLA
tara:strand:+ start:193 stop:573 length:381 start_codon:yes stop_codon:yes gene_type:complete